MLDALAVILLTILIPLTLMWLRTILLLYLGVLRWPQVTSVTANDGERLQESPPVAVLIPARNESRRLEEALRSAVFQDYPHYVVRILDDQSTDSTLEIARRIQSETENLEVYEGGDHPGDWVGKPWALKQLTDRSGEDWLLFLDADIVLHPRALTRAMEMAHKHQTDLLTFMPTAKLDSFWQRVLGITMGAFLVASLSIIGIWT